MEVFESSDTQKQEATVLVVDDQPQNITILHDTLTNAGFKVSVAQSGVSALVKATEVLPDLILLDVMMPNLDGYETCKRLKSDPLTQDVPVIFITALSDAQYTLKGFEVGGVDYITKPIRNEEVLARVRTHVALRQALLDLEHASQQMEKANEQLTEEIQQRKAIEVELREANATLEKISQTDGLTGIGNRRLFDKYLAHEWNRLAREQHPLSLLLCDIDFFKAFNDQYGHQEGDDCLRTVAKVISDVLQRPADIAARYGGEEFAVILPNTDEHGAMNRANSICKSIRNLKIESANTKTGYVTISIGVGSTIPTSDKPFEHFLKLVDEALYTAKREGRDKCIFNTF